MSISNPSLSVPLLSVSVETVPPSFVAVLPPEKSSCMKRVAAKIIDLFIETPDISPPCGHCGVWFMSLGMSIVGGGIVGEAIHRGSSGTGALIALTAHVAFSCLPCYCVIKLRGQPRPFLRNS